MKTREAPATEAIERRQYLTFFSGGEEYALGILRVKEIIEHDVLTRIPGAPPAVRGVINLRGTVVPVVDLALRLGLTETQITKFSCVVIVEIVHDGAANTLGLLADSVNQVVELTAEDIEPPPTFGTRIDAANLTGMARSGRKFILLLDVDKVFGDLAVGTLAAAGAQAEAEAAAAV